MRHPRRVLLAAVATVALAGGAGSGPARAAPGPPDVSAEAGILVEAGDGEVLWSREPEDRRAIASATKLMTALLVLERARMDDVFEAAPYQSLPTESKIDLRPGERMAVRDLLTALLLESANDAAVTLAEGVSGSVRRFVADMNDRARELGLDDTRYANPVGLDDPDNYSSAHDLARLTSILMRDRRFAEVVAMPSATLGSGDEPRTVENRNELVGGGFVEGVKTGYTQAAGNVLIGSASGRGVRVVSVVLGEATESQRDADTLALLRFGLDAFRRLRAVRPGERLAEAAVAGRGERVALVAAAPVSLTVRRGTEDEVEPLVDAPEELEGPLPAGADAGSVTVEYRGEPAGRALLETAAAVPAPPSRLPGLLRAVGIAAVVVGLCIVLAVLVLRDRGRRDRRSATGTR